MARLARTVAVGFPYHVTHRGNRREDIFFRDEDRRRYLELLRQYSAANGLQIWAYCLMTNHVHLLAVPGGPDALARGVGLTHRRHAQAINIAQGWTGHLWEHRFYSTALDEAHLWAAVKYIETNPVRAGLVGRAEEYGWSSARAHALGEADPLLSAGRPFSRAGRGGRLADLVGGGVAGGGSGPAAFADTDRASLRGPILCHASGDNSEAVPDPTKAWAKNEREGIVSYPVPEISEMLKRFLTPQKRGPKTKETG